ncbi:ATP-binding protein [Candidatus Synechococcus calcipolaris G9]|uniref:ATP-binding protein n=1 Tax=Candidatus Synechococcus calcipolaris G9 TaxID=1497997 RepID=A0ABT6F2D3_9SYNE|nr:ATP-binding protein [Candidatus Synechococcus calcipolaris]MDG2991970.1 ATP-binding protein [Candidatus Synechococcus calcipolaris G9]
MPRTSYGKTFLRQVGFVLETILWVEINITPEQQTLDRWLSEIHPHPALPHTTEIEVRTTLIQLLRYMREYGKYTSQFNQLFVPGSQTNPTIRKRNLERLRSVLYRLTELGYFKRLISTKKEECHFFLILPGLEDMTDYQTWLRTQLPHDWAEAQRAGQRKPPPTFASPITGRRQEIKALKDYFHRGVRLIILYGLPGVGKTVLAQQALGELGFSKIYRLTAQPDPYLPDWLKSQVGHSGQWQTYLKQHRAAVVIEGFQTCLDQQGYVRSDCQSWSKFLYEQRWAEGWLTIMTSNQIIAESKITSRSLMIVGLTVDDWRTDWNHRQISVSDTTLEAIHQTYGGHPKVMRILGNLICEQHQGNGEAFWTKHQYNLLGHPQIEDLYNRQWQPIKQKFPQQFQRMQKTLPQVVGCLDALEPSEKELLDHYLITSGTDSANTLALAQTMSLENIPRLGRPEIGITSTSSLRSSCP